MTDLTGRDALVRAGLDLVDELSLAKLYAGLTAKSVAERAGVTTGSFFHHFPTLADFADALAMSFLAEPNAGTETAETAEDVDDMVDALEHDRFADIMRTLLRAQWELAVDAPELARQFRTELMLWSHHPASLHRPVDGYSTVGDVLEATYRTREEAAAAGWYDLLERTGLVLIEGFTTGRMSTALTALWQGLQIRRALDRDAVDDDLFADVATLLTAAVVQGRGIRRPAGETVAAVLDEANLSPQARTGARRRRETRRRIIVASTGRFAAGWEEISASEVADWSGVATQTVFNLFGSVRGVAASTFRRHYRDYESAMRAELDTDPPGALRAALAVLADAAARDPEPARALLSERLAAHSRRGDDLPEGDIRVELPLVIVLVEPLLRLGLTEDRAIDVASTVINFVLSHAVPRPGRSDETVALAMRLLPEAVLRWEPPPERP